MVRLRASRKRTGVRCLPARVIRGAAVATLLLTGGCGSRDPGPVPAPAAERPSSTGEEEILTGEFWRDQGLEDVLPYWTRHARDLEHGGFFPRLDRTWQPLGDQHKYPGMVSRHLFSYATAYLLTGDAEYLEIADEIFEYVMERGWDPDYGLWYHELDRAGAVVDSTKDMFNQAYAITGLAMYYFVTRDPRVRGYIDQSLEILEARAWDEEYGGFIRALRRDLSVEEWRKDFSPQIAPVSGYLVYLYPATRDPAFLRSMEEILGVVVKRTRDPETGWVTGRFDRSWQPREPREEIRINVGHNLETAWLLMRLHLLTGNLGYLETATELADEMREQAFDPATGAWAHHLDLSEQSIDGESTPWWIQAYGNMVMLYQYRVTGDPRHLETFRAGAEFWNRAFMDPVYGATYLTVFLDGRVEKADKGVRTKTSYHAMEYALLSYLYLNLWVQDAPVELHFQVQDPVAGERLYPSPVEDPDVRIARVEINGRDWTDFDAEAGFITLPGDGPLRVTAVLVTR